MAKRIQRLYPKIQLIYLTGYIDYARDIFESDPVYFLVKPVDENKLSDAILRARVKCENKDKHYLALNTRFDVHKIYFDEIVYVESEKRNLHFHLNNRVISCMGQLSDIEKKCPKEFIRIHQSYLVNMNFIASYGITNIELSTGMVLPVSRNRNKKAKETFLKYVGEVV